MIKTEVQFLGMLRDIGFDFNSTVREISCRFPRELEWGVQGFEALRSELQKPFANFATQWNIPINRDVDFDLPPKRYDHEFHPYDNALNNFNSGLAQLTAILGPGTPGIAMNVLDRNWKLGFFNVRVIAFPPEKNPQMKDNVFFGKNPNLGISAEISVTPEFPFVEPSEDATEPLIETIIPSAKWRFLCNSPVYTRRNLNSIRSVAIVAGLLRQAFIIRAGDRTVRIPLQEVEEVALERLTPAEFSGESSISIKAHFLNRYTVNVSIASGTETNSLDDVACRLAQIMDRPLTVKEYPDCR